MNETNEARMTLETVRQANAHRAAGPCAVCGARVLCDWTTATMTLTGRTFTFLACGFCIGNDSYVRPLVECCPRCGGMATGPCCYPVSE